MKLIKKLLLKYYTNKLNDINRKIEFMEHPKILFSKEISDDGWNSIYRMFLADERKVKGKIKKYGGKE